MMSGNELNSLNNTIYKNTTTAFIAVTATEM